MTESAVTPARTAASNGAVTGRLSGPGMHTVRVIVRHGAPPTQAPDELADVVEPEYDLQGRICDWHLHASATHALDLPTIEAFRAWRAGFATERYLGELALVSGFIDWADHHGDVSKLHALRNPAGHLDVAGAIAMRFQIEQIQRQCHAAQEPALGIFSPPERTSPARGLLTTSPGAALACGPAALFANPDGLLLRIGTDEVIVTAWQSAPDGVVATTNAGERPLDGSPAARLLGMLGRQAPAVAVRAVPMSTVVAPMLTFAHDAAELAANTHTGIDVRIGR